VENGIEITRFAQWPTTVVFRLVVLRWSGLDDLGELPCRPAFLDGLLEDCLPFGLVFDPGQLNDVGVGEGVPAWQTHLCDLLNLLWSESISDIYRPVNDAVVPSERLLDGLHGLRPVDGTVVFVHVVVDVADGDGDLVTADDAAAPFVLEPLVNPGDLLAQNRW